MASRPTLLGEPRVLSEVEVARYRETERAMVRSRKILQRALEVADVSSSISLQGREDQLAWLEAGLESRFDGEILTLTFAGGSRRDNETILKAVVDAYTTELSTEDAELRNRVVRLEGQLRKLEAQLEERRNRRLVLDDAPFGMQEEAVLETLELDDQIATLKAVVDDLRRQTILLELELQAPPRFRVIDEPGLPFGLPKPEPERYRDIDEAELPWKQRPGPAG
jgi:hypothetical protein